MALTFQGTSLSFRVTEQNHVGDIRRAATRMGAEAGLDSEKTNDLAIGVTEAATNIVRHAGGGEIILTLRKAGDSVSIEMLALDRGPGIRDISTSLADGFSTGGSAGTGLGAIRRLADQFDIFSVADHGVALFAAFTASSSPPTAEAFEVGGLCVPVAGETECGDNWQVLTDGARAYIAVIDGLGHGPHAAEASHEAVRVFGEHPQLDPARMVENVHGALRKTRGAAGAFAEVNLAQKRIHFSGVGNITAIVVGGTHRRGMASTNGILGHELRRVQQLEYRYESRQTFVLHSDGLTSRWTMEEPQYVGLLRRRPSLVAGVLYRDFTRGRDDATVVVLSQRNQRMEVGHA